MKNNMARARKADQEKIEKILEKRRYSGGKTQPGYDVHHIIPLEDGGKDTPSNIRVIKRKKHKQIHKNRQKQGKI